MRSPGLPPISLSLGLVLALLLSGPAALASAEKARPVPPPTRIETLGRILALEDSRSVGEGELDRLLRARDRGIRRLALFALVRLKEPKAAAEALLLSGKPRFDWWAATWVASRMESPALRPVLVAAAASNDALSRTFAARGLGALKDASSLDVLDALAHDADATVAAYALHALAALADPRATAAAASF